MRDYEKELDSLAKQIEELKKEISGKTVGKPYTEVRDNVEVMHNMHPDGRLSELMEELCEKTDEAGSTGYIAYMGVFASGGRQSSWIKSAVPTDELLNLVEEGAAGRILACIGSATRLSILLEILRGPKTVIELTGKCNLGSVGQAYHHMKPLLAADLIVESADDRGRYIIQPHRVQGIIMLLAGISDMIDST